jgi:NAD(P)-dependent dehydrogenase (short-subunit alcohol dehydrogenase family)
MSSRHHLEFTGLIIAPDLVYPSGSALDLEPAIWQDTFNVKVLSNVSATRAFLPLIIQHHSRILFVTPSIIQSLKPAYNAVESSLGCALEAYITSLQREMSDYDVHVSHLKLGAVDFTSPPVSGASSPTAGGLVRAHAAAGAKELQYAVFDALTMARPFRIRRVGRGSMTYDIIGKLMPGSLVQWMMQGLKAKEMDGPVSADEWQDLDQNNKELIRSIHD